LTSSSLRARRRHFENDCGEGRIAARGRRAASTGTAMAIAGGMAAVLCLMFLPLCFGVLFMIGSMSGSLSIGVVMAGVSFVLLAAGLVVGAIRMAKDWDSEHTG
jgi:putative effector of murein hydrolase LrgA (UPF0299 family)